MTKKRSTTYRLNAVDYTIFIVCSIAAAVMLFLFYRDMNSFTIKQAEDPIAKIYFKKNTAQRKFIDSDIWEVLTSSSDVYDGDRIRTSNNSEAYTEFADGAAKIQLNEKSMIQIFQSKEQKSIDFIGGEIFIESNVPDGDKLVIHSGKTEIAISNKAEVKIALPEVTDAEAAGAVEAGDSVVVIEVVSGQVEVLDQSDGSEQTVAEVAPVLMNSGQSLTFGSERTETVTDKPADTQNAVKEPEKPKNPVQIVKEGIEKTITRSKETFAYNTWEENGVKRYNYEFWIPLSDLTEKFKIIPKGSLLEVEVSGTPSATLRYFAIQIGTGEEGEEWHRAHGFTWTNNGGYLAGGVPFDIKKPIVLDYDVVNTDRATVGISYEKGAAEVVISDLKVKVKVVSLSGGHNTTVAESGYSKTYEYGSLTLFKDVYGSGPNDYNYELYLNAEQIFGESVSIPAGRRVRFSISGTSSGQIQWFAPDIIYVDYGDWDTIIAPNWDSYSIRFSEEPTPANVPFAYSRSCELLKPLTNTNKAMFRLIVSGEGLPSAPTFSNLKLTFEVE
ncbi:MAG: FecR domain-containing protein [Treponema sp.]|nr:FecR domain-containing protein [Treponema sp.]